MLRRIQTKRTWLRPAERGDVRAIAEMASAVDVSRIDALLEQSSASWSDFGYGIWLIVDSESEIRIGWCGVRPGSSPNEPELLYGLAPAARGLGIATEAARAVVEYVLQLPGVESVWAATEPSHSASIGIMRRIGMAFESHRELDGVDSVIYRIRNGAANNAIDRTSGGIKCLKLNIGSALVIANFSR